MRLDGRRESSNVEDRRGMSGGAKAGIGGIGAIIVAALFAWMTGGDPLSAAGRRGGCTWQFWNVKT